MYFLAHPHSIGGAAKVLMIQAYLAQQSGNEVMVIIQNDETGFHSVGLECLCEHLHLNYTSEKYVIATCPEEIDILKSVEDYDRILPLVKNFNPDVLHSVQINTTVEYIARKLQIPHIMNIYQVSKDSFKLSWEDVFPYYHCCDSNYYCEIRSKGLRIKSKCIRVAYNSEAKSIRDITDICNFINIASFSEHKQQLKILEFIRYLREKRVQVHICFVGFNDNAYGELCKKYVIDNKLEKYVDFIGEVTSIEPYLLQADLMIHISKSESYPGVLVEALANRIPVMIKAEAGIPELIKDGENGYLVSDDSVESLYTVYNKINEDVNRGRLEKVIRNGYNTYLENHTYEVIQNDLKNFYKQIINEKVIVKEPFEAVIKQCSDIKDSYSLFTIGRVWYLYNLKKTFIERNVKSCSIWGAGVNSQIAIEWAEYLELDIYGFIDIKKQGEHLGYAIFAPDDSRAISCDVIIVSIFDIEARRNIMKYLDNLGRIRNVNYVLLFNDPCLVY